jgi:hypothetical protein
MMTPNPRGGSGGSFVLESRFVPLALPAALALEGRFVSRAVLPRPAILAPPAPVADFFEPRFAPVLARAPRFVSPFMVRPPRLRVVPAA